MEHGVAGGAVGRCGQDGMRQRDAGRRQKAGAAGTSTFSDVLAQRSSGGDDPANGSGGETDRDAGTDQIAQRHVFREPHAPETADEESTTSTGWTTWRTASLKALSDSTLAGDIRTITKKTLELSLFQNHEDFAGFITTALAPVDGMKFPEFYALYTRICHALPAEWRDQWITVATQWLAMQRFTRVDMFPTLHGEKSVRSAVMTEVLTKIGERAERGETTSVLILAAALGQDGLDLATQLELKKISRAMYSIEQRDIFAYETWPSISAPRVDVVTGTGLKSEDNFDVVMGTWLLTHAHESDIHKVVQEASAALAPAGLMVFAEHVHNTRARRAVSIAHDYVNKLVDARQLVHVQEYVNETGTYTCVVLTATAANGTRAPLLLRQMPTASAPVFLYYDDGQRYVPRATPVAMVHIPPHQKSYRLGLTGVYCWIVQGKNGTQLYVGSSRHVLVRGAESFGERVGERRDRAHFVVIASLADLKTSTINMIKEAGCLNLAMLDLLKLMMERLAIKEAMERHGAHCLNRTAETFTEGGRGAFEWHAFSGAFGAKDFEWRHETLSAVGDAGRREHMSDGLHSIEAFVGSVGAKDFQRRRGLLANIHNEDHRKKAEYGLSKMEAANLPSATLAQQQHQEGTQGAAAAALLESRLVLRVKRRNGIKNGDTMCIMPLHPNHSGLLADLRTATKTGWVEICGGVFRRHQSRPTAHWCRGNKEIKETQQCSKRADVTKEGGEYAPCGVTFQRRRCDSAGKITWT